MWTKKRLEMKNRPIQLQVSQILTGKEYNDCLMETFSKTSRMFAKCINKSNADQHSQPANRKPSNSAEPWIKATRTVCFHFLLQLHTVTTDVRLSPLKWKKLGNQLSPSAKNNCKTYFVMKFALVVQLDIDICKTFFTRQVIKSTATLCAIENDLWLNWVPWALK